MLRSDGSSIVELKFPVGTTPIYFFSILSNETGKKKKDCKETGRRKEEKVEGKRGWCGKEVVG